MECRTQAIEKTTCLHRKVTGDKYADWAQSGNSPWAQTFRTPLLCCYMS